MEISLTDWVDFVLTAGPAQLTKVKTLAARPEYHPRCDFWRPLREGLQNYHQGKGRLEDIVTDLRDTKKLRRYPDAILSYRKFLGRKHLAWFKPPSALWTYAGLGVRVNPELGLQFDGKKHVVKLYFKGERPTKHRLNVVFAMMRIALSLDEQMVPAVLDVGTARLITPRSAGEDLVPLLQAQAVAFVHMWNAVHTSPPITVTASA